MSVARPIGTLADVKAARRALIATFEPSTQFYLAWAAVFAVFCASTSGVLELLSAISLHVYPYYGRRWFRLTAIGRSAYRRHLRALVSTELPTVADQVP